MGRLFLESSMEHFVNIILQDYHDKIFGMYPRDASTPALPGIVLRKNSDKKVTSSHKEYCSKAGKLFYFVKEVGPVCTNACQEVSQHLENLGQLLLGVIAN